MREKVICENVEGGGEGRGENEDEETKKKNKDEGIRLKEVSRGLSGC